MSDRPPDPAGRIVPRESWRHAVGAGSRAAFGQPPGWPVALAGFLARGGLLLFVLPFVVLPTPTGIATIFGPDIISVAISSPNPGVYRLVALGVLGLAAWLAVASAVGSAADVATIRVLSRHADAGDVPAGTAGHPIRALRVRVATVRLLAHLPTAAALVWGASRVVDAVYRQYIFPGDLAVPLPVRVVASIPDVIVLLLVVWLLGEALGGLAARDLVLRGSGSVPGSLWRGVVHLVRHPLSSVATHLLGTVGLTVVLVPALLIAMRLWSDARVLLLGGGPWPAVVGAAVAFSAAWLGALGLAAVGSAWRSGLWTAEAERERGPAGQPAAAGLAHPAAHPS